MVGESSGPLGTGLTATRDPTRSVNVSANLLA